MHLSLSPFLPLRSVRIPCVFHVLHQYATFLRNAEQGSFAAFFVCSISTLLLFGCCCHLSDEDSNLQHGGESASGRDSKDLRSSGSVLGDFSGCAEMSGSGSGNDGRLQLQLWYALLGGVSGAVGELLPLGVDDNLSMPIVSGGVFLALVGASGSIL